MVFCLFFNYFYKYAKITMINLNYDFMNLFNLTILINDAVFVYSLNLSKYNL